MLVNFSGCKECQCNGHGDERFGYCNVTDGECFCKDHTTGPHCQYCKDGYYGNPR